VIDDPARNIENAFVPFGSDKLVVIETQGATLSSSLFEPASGEEMRLPRVAGNLYLLAPVGEREWVAYYAVSDQPTSWFGFR